MTATRGLEDAQAETRLDGKAMPKRVSATLHVQVKVPSCRLSDDDLVALAKLMEKQIHNSEWAQTSFDVEGRDFKIEAKASEALRRLEWPEAIKSVYFMRLSGDHKIKLHMARFVGWYTNLEVSGPDPTWVRGVAAQMDSFLKKRKTSHRMITSPWVVAPAAALFWFTVCGTLALAISAAGGDLSERGSLARDSWIFASLGLASVTFFAASMVPGYLFPHIEIEVKGEIPLHRKLRAWAFGIFGLLVLGVVSSLIASGIVLVASS